MPKFVISTHFAALSPWSWQARGGEDVYLVAMDQELYPLWATNIGSSESDESGGAAVDIYGAGIVVR